MFVCVCVYRVFITVQRCHLWRRKPINDDDGDDDNNQNTSHMHELFWPNKTQTESINVVGPNSNDTQPVSSELRECIHYICSFFITTIILQFVCTCGILHISTMVKRFSLSVRGFDASKCICVRDLQITQQKKALAFVWHNNLISQAIEHFIAQHAHRYYTHTAVGSCLCCWLTAQPANLPVN